jgi:signal peptidase I
MMPPPADAARSDDVRVDYGPVTVPADQYFMMGDNRDNSEDSRYWGFMPASYVKGQALFIYLSLGDSLGDIQWSRLLNRVR